MTGKKNRSNASTIRPKGNKKSGKQNELFSNPESNFFAPTSRKDMQTLVREVSQVHTSQFKRNKFEGDPVGEKRDDIVRIGGENFNGIAAWKARNPKIDLARKFISRYQLDAYLGSELNSNFGKTSRSPAAFLNAFSPSSAVQGVLGYNLNENDTRYQRGGTCNVIINELTSFVKDQGTDTTNLGRWTWTLLEGANSHKTRLISAYAPVKNDSKGYSTYGQQRRYFRARKDKRCPQNIFRDDLKKFIKRCKKTGE